MHSDEQYNVLKEALEKIVRTSGVTEWSRRVAQTALAEAAQMEDDSPSSKDDIQGLVRTVIGLLSRVETLETDGDIAEEAFDKIHEELEGLEQRLDNVIANEKHVHEAHYNRITDLDKRLQAQERHQLNQDVDANLLKNRVRELEDWRTHVVSTYRDQDDVFGKVVKRVEVLEKGGFLDGVSVGNLAEDIRALRSRTAALEHRLGV